MSTEAEIRQENIDKQLAEAGWSRAQGNLVTEAFLSGTNKRVRERSPDDSHLVRNESNRAFADYVLLGKDGKPLAVLEAKRDSRSPLEGERQAVEYAELIYQQTGKLPFIFLSNGDETYFIDSDHGALGGGGGPHRRQRPWWQAAHNHAPAAGNESSNLYLLLACSS
jgi:type I restriction enzyme, R subunit